MEIGHANGKDCDIGYAPTADSCEGVRDPDTCTVAVLDATTASAVSDPDRLSQGWSVFSGPSAQRVASLRGSLSLLRIGKILFKPTLSAIDGRNPNRPRENVNAEY
jgi:hypothetical protein